MPSFVSTIYADLGAVASPLGYASKADPILYETSAAFRCRLDPGFTFSYPGGTLTGRAAPVAPVNGQTIYDVAQRNNGTFNLKSGDAVGFSNGGFDFSTINQLGSGMVMPNDTLASIYAASHAYFALLMYIRLPTAANWFTAGVNGYLPLFKTSANGFNTQADLLSIVFPGTGTNRISFMRQNATPALGNVDNLSINTNAPCQGAVCQIAFVRTASGQTALVRPVATGGTLQTATAAVGAENPNNYGGNSPQFGPGNAFAGWATGAGSTQSGSSYKLYDATIMDLTAGGNPLATDSNGLTLFDRDLARVQALITQSAAANAGVSQIYN